MSTVFIRYYVELAHPMPDLERPLLDVPSSWLPNLAENADQRGQRLLTEVGFPIDGHRITKRVSILMADPVRSPARTWMPVSWRATGPSGLFPILDGDLEIASLGCTCTQLAFSARYNPPLGFIGRTVDRALLSRIAEATVKDFVDRIAERLEAQVARRACLKEQSDATVEGPPSALGANRSMGTERGSISRSSPPQPWHL